MGKVLGIIYRIIATHLTRKADYIKAVEYRCFKRYIARNPRVLNGYTYQVFSQSAAQSDPV